MKRFLFFLLTVVMTCCYIKYAMADNEVLVYVVRPQVIGRNANNPEELVAFNFGAKLKYLGEVKLEYGDYALVKDNYGTYLIKKPYLYYADYMLLKIDSEGVCLSPNSTISDGEFGYCAGGMRYDEDAIILFEETNSYYIVTSEGFSGFVDKENPHIVAYN